MFPRCKSVHKMSTGESDDELIQLDDKMRLWTRSEKIRKVKKLWLGDEAQHERK